MQNHKKQGIVTEYHPNGEVKSEKSYKNDKRHGLSTYWRQVRDNTSDDVYKAREENYKHGKRHGLTIEYHENGQKEYMSILKDGKLQGMNSWWNKSGKRSLEVYYIQSKIYATIDWNKDGDVTETELPTPPHPTTSPAKTNQKPKALKQNMQTNQEKTQLTEYHPNGKIKSKLNYKNGIKHGVETIWDESDQKRYEGNWKDGKKHGISTWWWDSGGKSSEETWKDHKKHGLRTWWDKNGRKEMEEYFIQDRRHLHIGWNEEGSVTNVLFQIPNPTPSSPAKTNQKPKAKYAKP